MLEEGTSVGSIKYCVYVVVGPKAWFTVSL